jgi:hypothetical protein
MWIITGIVLAWTKIRRGKSKDWTRQHLQKSDLDINNKTQFHN